MIQFFVFGSSSVYGVGGEKGGWADMIKLRLHQNMYSDGGVGEKYELYNFGKSGATIRFVQNTFKNQLKNYRRNCKIIALASVGGNNSKAENEPDNYVSTLKEYREEMVNFLTELKREVDRVLFIGGGYVDELKTNPKPNPLTGGKSFFSNKRRIRFDVVLQEICRELSVDYIAVDVGQEEWIEKYLHADGLHANTVGYKYIADKVWKNIEKEL